MLEETKRHFFKKLIDDTFGYYRIYDALKIRIKNLNGGHININSPKEFWTKIIENNPEIIDRQIVKLRDLFMSDWLPKLPGQVWTKEGELNLMEGPTDIKGFYSINDKVYKVLGPTGKLKMVMGGYGSVRVKPSSNDDYCTILNLVKVEGWHCDYGIPIVVSKPVYEQFLKYKEHRGSPWIEEVSGILHLDKDVPNINKLSAAIGSKFDTETVEILTTQPHLRKAFIYISSPLDVKFRYNGSSPQAVAWTLYKTTLENEPLRLTYAHFDPSKEESIYEAVGFITTYVANFDGEVMLTDFDGIQKRLIASSSLTNQAQLVRNHTGTLKLINDWIKAEKRHRNKP
jgi:hypothetical protein